MNLKIKNLLKWYLFITSIYLLCDGLIHVFDLKLINVTNWPEAPFVYSQYMGRLYGLFVVLAALFGIEASRNLEKYRNLLYICGIWGVVYSVFLIYNGLKINFVEVFMLTPSIYFWLPFYNVYIIGEAVILLILSGLILLYRKNS